MYKEEILELKIKGNDYKLTQITNIDEIFDALIESNPQDENIVDERIPYWTELWPSAIGLSEYILENKELFEQKRVIEIGGGLGLPSIVSASLVKEITMTDYLDEAINFAKKNAQLNNIDNMSFEVMDWRNIESSKKYDIILASDIAYEKRFFEDLPQALKSMMHYNSIAILSEPGRLFAKEFIDDLSLHFFVRTFMKEVSWRGSKFNVGVYVLRGKA